MKEQKTPKIRNVSDQVMNWIGSPSSLIAHTLFFIIMFAIALLGIPLDKILLVLTTVVSLEAVYMAIFIQMAVNQNTQSLQSVEEDIDEIQEDVDEIQKDVDDIQEDVDDIEKDDDQHLLHGQKTQAVLSNIEVQLQNLIKEIETIKKEKK